jgi:hypothetical protein
MAGRAKGVRHYEALPIPQNPDLTQEAPTIRALTADSPAALCSTWAGRRAAPLRRYHRPRGRGGGGVASAAAAPPTRTTRAARASGPLLYSSPMISCCLVRPVSATPPRVSAQPRPRARHSVPGRAVPAVSAFDLVVPPERAVHCYGSPRGRGFASPRGASCCQLSLVYDRPPRPLVSSP